MVYRGWLTHYISTSFLTTHNTASHSQCCHQMLLTVGITYSQLGWILYILYDPDPFDFLHLSFSVLFHTDKLHVRLKRLHGMQTLSPGSTFAQINSMGLTVFQSWPLEWSCSSSKWNWFQCSGLSQTGLAVWQFQTISPWTVRAETRTGSKTTQSNVSADYE